MMVVGQRELVHMEEEQIELKLVHKEEEELVGEDLQKETETQDQDDGHVVAFWEHHCWWWNSSCR